MIDFPANPTTGQSFTAAGVTWVWDGQKWNVNSVAAGQYIIISATPPTNPIIGSLWWDSTGGQLYIYYNDGNSAQWVTAINQGFGGLYLPLSGGTLTGPLILAADPTVALGAATKEYVDIAPNIIPKNYPLNSNRIINGDMRIDQRNNGANVAGAASLLYIVDRWAYNSSLAGHFTLGRNGGGSGQPGPLGFPYCLGAASTSAYVSAASDIFQLFQPIEADMVSDFAWGTPNAQPVTLSFWVYSSLTGTFSGSVANYAGTRCYPFTFSIPTASTWTKIVITVPGDIAGTWVMSGNGGSIYLRFDLGSGSTYRAAAGAWLNGIFVGATGAVSVVATNGATFYVTGVKLEIGSVATPFNYDSLTKRLADCQRYYQQPINIMAVGYGAAGGPAISQYLLPVMMRATPTVTFGTVTYSNSTALVTNVITSDGLRLQVTVTAAGLGWGASVPLMLAAEL
jgi:hypothetical protein